MVYTVNSCCCGCSLKTGTLIIGTIQAVVCGLVLVGVIIILCGEQIQHETYEENYAQLVGLFTVLCILLGLQLLFSSLLICGANNDNPRFLMPWIIYTIVCLVLNVIGGIVVAAIDESGNGLKSLGSTVAGSSLTVYFIIVVNSFRQQLKNQTQMAIGKNNVT